MIQVDIAGIDAATHKTWLKTVSLEDGATVADALKAAGQPSEAEAAVFNEKANASQPLSDGDRVDVLSPLTVDPMTARRLRLAAKTTPREENRGRHGGRHRLLSAV